MKTVIEFALSNVTSDDGLLSVLSKLVEYLRSKAGAYGRLFGQLLSPFFEKFPQQALDAVYIQDPDGSYRTAARIISNTDDDRRETALKRIPIAALLAWCDASPTDRFLFAAQHCRFFKKSETEGDGHFEIAETAKGILERAPDKPAVFAIFLDRLRPRSHWGNLSQELRKRIPLLASLNIPGNAQLEAAIRAGEINLLHQADVAAEREDAEERKRTSSFE
jgi:hypothetical protein